jgi:hypothetical protein
MPPLGDWILGRFGPPFSLKFGLTLTSDYRGGDLDQDFLRGEVSVLFFRNFAGLLQAVILMAYG